jgi:hypothetical protein
MVTAQSCHSDQGPGNLLYSFLKMYLDLCPLLVPEDIAFLTAVP